MRPSHVRLTLLALSVMVGGLACGRDPTTMVDGEFASILVYGQVLQPDGAPAAGVSVALEALRLGSCEGPPSDRTSAVADTSGRYRAVLGNWGKRYTVCVRVQATPSPDSGLTPGLATRSPVEMRASPLDSVRVDVHLGPR